MFSKLFISFWFDSTIFSVKYGSGNLENWKIPLTKIIVLILLLQNKVISYTDYFV